MIKRDVCFWRRHRGENTHTDFVKFGHFRMFWAGIYLRFDCFLFSATGKPSIK